MSTDETVPDIKKPRRSERIQSQSQAQTNPVVNQSQLPSPLTHALSTATEDLKEATEPPPDGRPSQIRSPIASPHTQGLSSPPVDTQALSQFVYPPSDLAPDVKDEKAEGVWGYLVPLDNRFGDTLVLRKRASCPQSSNPTDISDGKRKKGKAKSGNARAPKNQKASDAKPVATGGYLIGRHPECGVSIPSILVTMAADGMYRRLHNSAPNNI